MPVDIAAVPDCGEFAELDTREEVLAYLIAVSRAEGWDEVVTVEAAATVMSRDELRHARDVLKRLGYHEVARKLTEMAGKKPRVPKLKTGGARVHKTDISIA
jgi:hypothetical protein